MLLRFLAWLGDRRAYRGHREVRRKAAKVPHCWRQGLVRGQYGDVTTSRWVPYDPALRQPALSHLNPKRNPYHIPNLKGWLYHIKVPNKYGRLELVPDIDPKAGQYDRFNPLAVPKFSSGFEGDVDDETMEFFVFLYEEAILAASHGVPHLLIEPVDFTKPTVVKDSTKETDSSLSTQGSGSVHSSSLSSEDEDSIMKCTGDKAKAKTTVASVSSSPSTTRSRRALYHSTIVDADGRTHNISDLNYKALTAVEVRKYEVQRIRFKAHIEQVIITKEAIKKANEALKPPSPKQKLVRKLNSLKPSSKWVIPPVDPLHWVPLEVEEGLQ